MAEPLDVVVSTHAEFQINETSEGIELVKLGQRRILWRQVVPTGEFIAAMEAYLDRRKASVS